MPTLLRPAAFALILSLMLPNVASACEDSERLRLTDEIENLVKKNAWTGVERKYTELEKMRCDVDSDTHNAGAQAARFLGKTYEMYQRLQAAYSKEEDPAVQESISGIENTYGKVEIRGSARKRAALVREAMPFPPDQIKSIKYAQTVMDGRGSFKGMLPLGEYQVADQPFSVEVGPEFQTILVGKTKAAKPGDGPSDAPPRNVSDEGLIAWMGPIAMVGGGLWGSMAPNEQIYETTNSFYTASQLVFSNGDGVIGPDGHCREDLPGGVDSDRFREDIDGQGTPGCYATTRQPGDISNVGVIDLTLGWEVGLTYTRPEVGVFVTGSYRRTPLDKFNQIVFQAGPVVRPGIFRITAGPTWGLVVGSTRKFADWTDEGQYNVDLAKEENVPSIVGVGYGGGVAGSVGAVLVDAGPFEGTIEAHGHWMRDNQRSYSGVGIRIGIVPKLERFQD